MIRTSLLASTLVVALSPTLGCSSVDNKTQVTVALASETEIPKELDSFALRVFSTRTGELRFSKDYYPSSGREFPTTLAVIPFDEDSLESPVRIELEGRVGATVFLRRQAVVSYVKDRNLLLSMPLRMACFQFQDCGPNSTCAGGQCVSSAVDPAKLVDFDPKLVFGDQGACFDEEKCLPATVETKVDPDCTFAIPEGSAEGQGNVSIRWAAAPARVLALDANDAQEGWTRLSATRGKLSQGACDSHFQRLGGDQKPLVPDWAKTVYFTPTCPSKTSLLPYCLSEATKHAGIGAVVP